MRGRGRWGAIGVAAVRTRDFISGCRKSPKAPLIRGCRRTFSPSQRGEGTSMRVHQSAALHSCDSASLPSPRASGAKVVRMRAVVGGVRSTLQLCARATSSAVAGKARKRPSSAAAAAPSPRRHGEKGLHAHSPECSVACLRRHQLPFAPRQRGEGGAAAPDEGPWAVGRDRRCSSAQAPHFSAVARKARKRPSSAAAAAPSPRRNGEKGQACAITSVQRCMLATAPASLRPAGAGRRWRGSAG